MKKILVSLLLVSMLQAEVEYQEGLVVGVEPMTKGFCDNGIDELVVVRIKSNKRTMILDCSTARVGETYWIKIKVNNNGNAL